MGAKLEFFLLGKVPHIIPEVYFFIRFYPRVLIRDTALRVTKVHASIALPVPFPLFWLNQHKVSLLFQKHINIGLTSALLVVNPISKTKEIPREIIDELINDSMIDAERKRVEGKDLTPFLLKNILQKTGGQSLSANISLAEDNINIGARIAKQLYKSDSLSLNKFRNEVCPT